MVSRQCLRFTELGSRFGRACDMQCQSAINPPKSSMPITWTQMDEMQHVLDSCSQYLYAGLQSLLRYCFLASVLAERHDSASGSCIELDLRNCIEIDQIGRIESDKINFFVYFEEPQSLESLRPHSDCLPCLTQTTWMTSWKALASNITIYLRL